ncbi:type IV pilin N-terminal domain-containing protein [Halobacterium salinarum]|uniref:type IV pilin N-terminal domain-containing protein n=1 Tax=Halobacterium salinarum TaxID=2242 RepID=UPI0025555BA9|nr:type IV pilin N-terminal domain-containing protein [Halobacterium salinarum]MDL0127994.1 type IV pilin N-terminal domain-containing protein [Halobacterium salinarum]
MTDLSLFDTDADERAVSPVIGVILMVAITVILAAVIATAVLGFGDGNLQSNAQAGVTVEQNATDTYDVTLTKLGDNTEGIYCSDKGYDENVTSVGNRLTDCDENTSVVAYTSGNDTQVVRTL